MLFALRQSNPSMPLVRWINAASRPEPFGKIMRALSTAAQNRAPLQDVFNRLLRTGIIKSAFILQPAHGRSDVGLRR